MTDPHWILLSGLVAAVVGATAAIASQFIADWLARKRELDRFRVQSFERFRREFSEDQHLKAIANKYPESRLENKKIEDYIGFFEEIGIYASRDLVDVELVDTILGDAIVECYEDRDIIDFVRSVRIERAITPIGSFSRNWPPIWSPAVTKDG